MTYPPEKREQWLEAYRVTRSKSDACKATGVHMSTAADWETRFPDFAAGVREVQMRVADLVHNVALDRALNGYEEPVIYKGTPQLDKNGRPITVRRHSDKLLLAAAAHFAGWNRDEYQERTTRKEVFLIDAEGNEMSLQALLQQTFSRVSAPKAIADDDQAGPKLLPPKGHPRRNGGNGKHS